MVESIVRGKIPISKCAIWKSALPPEVVRVSFAQSDIFISGKTSASHYSILCKVSE